MSIGNNKQIIELTDDDIIWIENSLETTKEMIEYYLNVEASYYFEPDLLDEVYTISVLDLKNGGISESVIINSLGCGLGQVMVDKLNFKWIIYEDEYGKDIALKHKCGFIAFPISSVQKRIGNEERGFFRSIYDSFKSELKKNL